MRTLYFNGIKNLEGIESLKTFGFASRNERSDEYICVYKSNEKDYDYAYLRESEIHELINGESWMNKEDITNFFNKIQMDKKSFQALDFTHKAYSLISNFPVEDVMGKSIDPMSFEEALNFIRDAEI